MRKLYSKKTRFFLQILLFILFFFGVMSWQTRDMLSAQTPVSMVALQDLKGQIHSPLSARRQKTLLYFFAPWCGICRVSMPKLNYLNHKRVKVYAIALSYKSPQKVQQFVQDVGYKGTVLLGTKEIEKQLKINAFPSYYVLNQEHKITHKGLGLVSIINIWWQTL